MAADDRSRRQCIIEFIGHTKDADWTIDRAAQWPNGVPISMLSHGHWDKTLVLHVTLRCERTPEAITVWQPRTWEKVIEAHERLQEDYERAVLEASASERGALRDRRRKRTGRSGA
jgi:hypothetical protein